MIGTGCVDIGIKEKEYLNRVLDSGLITCGPILDQFESQFAKRHGRSCGLMVNSGTDALRIAVAALAERDAWEPEDEVIVPALTFVASSNVILQNGLKPVFVDVHPDTFNIDPEAVKQAITPRTRAIMVVHLFGLPCDMAEIVRIADDEDLRVIEDSCEAMAVNYRGQPVGSFGDIACFSTYAAHIITTGVGGLAITNDKILADLMRSYANHGRDPQFLGFKDSRVLRPENYLNKDAHAEMIDARFRFERIGYSSRATQLQAALGLAQLERIDDIVFERQNNVEFFRSRLEGLTEIRLQKVPEDRENACMMFPIVVSERVSRQDLMLNLERKGIETRPFFNVLGQAPYITAFGNIEPNYPVAMELSQKGLYVGCHQRLQPADVWQVADGIEEFFQEQKVVA